MALIVEDGTGKADAQTYSTVAELDAYAALRGITLTASTEEAKEVLLVKAMDYLESLQGQYIGTKYSEAQALQWPRLEVYIDTFYIEYTTIPKELKNAQLLAAVIIDGGGDLQPSISPKVIEEQIDSLRVKYSESSASYTYYPQLTRALSAILSTGGTGFTVSRG